MWCALKRLAKQADQDVNDWVVGGVSQHEAHGRCLAHGLWDAHGCWVVVDPLWRRREKLLVNCCAVAAGLVGYDWRCACGWHSGWRSYCGWHSDCACGLHRWQWWLGGLD